MSGLGHAARMGEALPATMRAAVYKGDRRVEVEDYPVPELGPGRRAARGEPLRGLRLGHPLRARGLGPAELGRRPRVHRARSPRSAPAVTRLDGRRRRRRWPVGALRRVRVLPRRPAEPLLRPRRGGRGRRLPGCVRRLHQGAGGASCCACPTACRCATPRSPSRSRSRCTASRRARCSRASGCSSPAADRSARSRSPRSSSAASPTSC